MPTHSQLFSEPPTFGGMQHYLQSDVKVLHFTRLCGDIFQQLFTNVIRVKIYMSMQCSQRSYRWHIICHKSDITVTYSIVKWQVNSIKMLNGRQETSLGKATRSSFTRVVCEQNTPDYAQNYQQATKYHSDYPEIVARRWNVCYKQNTRIHYITLENATLSLQVAKYHQDYPEIVVRQWNVHCI